MHGDCCGLVELLVADVTLQGCMDPLAYWSRAREKRASLESASPASRQDSHVQMLGWRMLDNFVLCKKNHGRLGLSFIDSVDLNNYCAAAM